MIVPKAVPLTLDGLKGLSDIDLLQSILEYGVNRTSSKRDATSHTHAADHYTQLAANIERLPEAIRTVYLSVEFEDLCAGDGVYSLFYNGPAQYAKLTIDALRSVGADRQADIYEKAYLSVIDACNGSSKLKQHLEQRGLVSLFSSELLDGFPDELETAVEELEEQLFSHPDEVRRLCVRYAREHLSEIAVE